MKFNKYIMLSGLLIASCGTEEIEKPDFQVTTESNNYQVGEEIKFTMEGHADLISFYSGEPLNDYAFREGRVINVADEGATLEFSSGVTGGTQQNQLSFYASTDFDGNYDDFASVNSATWVDITDRFTLGKSGTFVSSTVQDVSDLLLPNKPIYFGFKYVTRPQKDNGLAATWMIQNLTLKSLKQFNNTELVITDHAHAGFRIVDQEPENAPSRSSVSTTRLSLLGNIYKDPEDPIYDPENPIYDPENPIYDPESHLYEPNTQRPTYVPYDPDSPYNDPYTETWAVSSAIYTDKVDLGPDWSNAIKGISNPKLEEYRYIYNKAGKYTAYFVATNVTISGREDVIKEFNFTIAP